MKQKQNAIEFKLTKPIMNEPVSPHADANNNKQLFLAALLAQKQFQLLNEQNNLPNENKNILILKADLTGEQMIQMHHCCFFECAQDSFCQVFKLCIITNWYGFVEEISIYSAAT